MWHATLSKQLKRSVSNLEAKGANQAAEVQILSP